MYLILVLSALLLPILVAVSGKYRETGGPWVTGFRLVVGLLGYVLILAGLAGLGLCGWLVVNASRGNASGILLLALLVGGGSLLPIFFGKMLVGMLRGSSPEQMPSRVQSSGWTALEDAALHQRHGKVAPHLRPEALLKAAGENADVAVPPRSAAQSDTPPPTGLSPRS